MRLSLSKKQFVELCARGAIPPLSAPLPFASPAAVYESLLGESSVLLESAGGAESIARYSFIAVDPYLELRVRGLAVEVLVAQRRGVSARDPLEKLKEILSAYPQRTDPALPPFQGGAIGFLGYDFVHHLERLPRTAKDDLGIPDAHFLVADRVVSFDHREKRAWIVVCPGARRTGLGYNALGGDFAAMYDEAEAVSAEIGARIMQGGSGPFEPPGGHPREGLEIVHEMPKGDYVRMVQKAKEYIRAGDIFQANLSQRLSAFTRDAHPWSLYLALRRINPSPFAAFLSMPGYFLVSSSPERLVLSRDGLAQTRPIAGTRPRGSDAREDEVMRRDLLLNAKERAEHIMLIDLERNDLGKVCAYGSVEVNEFMVTEAYSHVIHIVSNVRGALARDRDSFDLVRAVFPGGTITGVPKVRCMEIIDELEPVARGPYTGSIGYIGYAGTMDMNIIIRTFVIKDGRACIHAGAGIVADSVPEREYEETLKKAEALMRALGELSVRCAGKP